MNMLDIKELKLYFNIIHNTFTPKRRTIHYKIYIEYMAKDQIAYNRPKTLHIYNIHLTSTKQIKGLHNKNMPKY